MADELRGTMQPLQAFDFRGWIDANRHRMIPPISNETVFKGNDTFIVMVSSGPNTRKDYHYNESEELFLQLEGDLEIGLYADGRHDAATVREGEMFLLPPRVPHQPRRPPGTLGLILEKHRVRPEQDGFLYFCDACGGKLYEEYFFLEDIVQQFPLVQRSFYGSVQNRTCRACGHVTEPPENWDRSIDVRGADNPYADDPLAEVRGRSW
jgi:3-hydroxyanthranilate 3,4-dioxygenase